MNTKEFQALMNASMAKIINIDTLDEKKSKLITANSKLRALRKSALNATSLDMRATLVAEEILARRIVVNLRKDIIRYSAHLELDVPEWVFNCGYDKI